MHKNNKCSLHPLSIITALSVELVNPSVSKKTGKDVERNGLKTNEINVNGRKVISKWHVYKNERAIFSVQ